MVKRMNLLLRFGIGAIATSIAFGCQSYSPRPPDLAGHYAAWLARTPDDAKLSAYANSLSAESTQSRTPLATSDLSLADAELVALMFNAELRRMRSRVAVALASFHHADHWDDPVFNAGFERVLASVAHPWEAFSSISFTLPVSGRLDYLKKHANAELQAALYETYAQEWTARIEVRRAWIMWSAASEKMRLAHEYLQQLDEIVDLVYQLQAVGDIAAIHARLFEIERTAQWNEARDFAAESQEHALQLRHLMGLPPSVALEMLSQLAPAEYSQDLTNAPDLIQKHHPLVHQRLAEYESAERSLALEIRKQYPDLIISPGYGYEDGNNRILFGISIPLPIWNRNQRAIAEAMAQRDYMQAVLETMFEQLMHELALADARHKAATAQLERLRDTIAPLVDQQFNAVQRLSQVGRLEPYLLLDALRQRYQTKLSLVSLQSQQSLASISLEAVLCTSLHPFHAEYARDTPSDTVEHHYE